MNDPYNLLIEKNFERMSLPPYDLANVFREKTYSWPGDHEGRALLSFCLHAAISGRKVPQFDDFWKALPAHLNPDGYFGSPYDGKTIYEQQLSGNSWFLRSLLTHHEVFKDQESLDMARRVVENLYLPCLPHYSEYPTNPSFNSDGGVYGEVVAKTGKWQLSSDIGCLFISLDGLTHYYEATKDERLLPLLDAAIDHFAKIDKVGFRMQTHAALSASRGILRLFQSTKDQKYLRIARSVFDLYLAEGMGLDYENFNWFKRPDTWTEPCCVVDSLILALKLFEITEEDRYRVLARRIFFGGFQFSIRPNGGAGPNTCVTAENPILRMSMEEACQCCTMRLAEGLYYYSLNRALFGPGSEDLHQEGNRYFKGDRLLAADLSGSFGSEPHYQIDGHSLIAIPNLLSIDWEKARKAQLQIVFPDAKK